MLEVSSKWSSERLTPLLSQYRAIKEKYPDALLLFRMGDFYEMLYEDAVKGAKILGISLTKRSYGRAGDVPLAGIPEKSLDTYLRKLLKEGIKVAVCEQLESPGQGKKLLKRDVVEVITPGTITDPELLEDTLPNYLFSIVVEKDKAGFSYLDLSTGEFKVGEGEKKRVVEILKQLKPSEIIVPEDSELGFGVKLPFYYFDKKRGYEILCEHFKVENLEGFGMENLLLAIRAAGAVLSYVAEQKKGKVDILHRISVHTLSEEMFLDDFTVRNLEIFETQRERKREGSLFSILDKTFTPAGSRTLYRWLKFPLISLKEITKRLDVLEEITKNYNEIKKVEELLRNFGDPERLVGKIIQEKANPRDLYALSSMLEKAEKIGDVIKEMKSERIKEIASFLKGFSDIIKRIKETLVESPPVKITEGNIIREGINDELDELRKISKDSKSYILQLEKKEKEKTGIPNLRVGYNSVFGYYIEVTKSYLSKVPSRYLRKQTLTNVERFITPELKEIERKIIHADERISVLEHEIFLSLRRWVKGHYEKLQNMARAVAVLDVFISLAKVSLERGYTRPVLDNSTIIEIKDGRHPVVESMIGERFVPNDSHIDRERNQIILLTGPNMSGKSTYLRQVALIVIMAQMGCFVPASYARIGLVDKIFTRIGASDDVSRGVSTFLAEMLETANILNNVTERSLVILDEIGRGTSTYDGMAIAWAVIEYFHNTEERPRTLFATHYHELTELEKFYDRVRNYSFMVKEKEGGIVFLRRLKKGPSNRSYGIEVAKLAGLPPKVIDRAKEILEKIYKGERLNIEDIIKERIIQLTLFSGTKTDEVVKKLKKIDVERITPLEALEILAELKKNMG